MRFLITGAAGQLGSEWKDVLSNKNADYYAFSSSGLDITQQKNLISKLDDIQPDVFINCAAYTKVDQAEDEKKQAFRINSEAVALIADLCKERGIKLVHYSTDYVFAGDADDQIRFPLGYPENHETNPKNVYGKSKLKGEEAILSSGCDFILMRVSWLCGRYGSNFVKTMLRLGRQNNELTVVNDQIGSPAFAADVVENTLTLLEEQKNGLYHYCSEGKISWYEFAGEIFRQSGIEVKLKAVKSTEFSAKAKRPAFSLLSTQKISDIPGINIPEWKEALNHLLNQLNED